MFFLVFGKCLKTVVELHVTFVFAKCDLEGIYEDRYLRIVGRDKNLIVSGGCNIFSKEIDLVLDDHPDLLANAVIGMAHSDFGKTILGIIVVAPQRVPDFVAIMDAIRAALARFEHPCKFVLLD